MSNIQNLTGGDWWAMIDGGDFYTHGPHSNPLDLLLDWIDEHDEDAKNGSENDRGFDGLVVVAYATNPPIPLSAWIDAETIIRTANSRISRIGRLPRDYDGDPPFAASPEQLDDLDQRLKAAMNDWQAVNELEFGVAIFEAVLFRREIRIRRAPGEPKETSLQRALAEMEATL